MGNVQGQEENQEDQEEDDVIRLKETTCSTTKFIVVSVEIIDFSKKG